MGTSLLGGKLLQSKLERGDEEYSLLRYLRETHSQQSSIAITAKYEHPRYSVDYILVLRWKAT